MRFDMIQIWALYDSAVLYLQHINTIQHTYTHKLLWIFIIVVFLYFTKKKKRKYTPLKPNYNELVCISTSTHIHLYSVYSVQVSGVLGMSIQERS